jgi:hypothetical protein
MTATNRDEAARRFGAIRPGYYWYNQRRYKVTGVQRWWIKYKGLKLAPLGGVAIVDTTQKGTGAYQAGELELLGFAKSAKRLDGKPKSTETE